MEGLVDFRNANSQDAKWHQHLRLILSGLVRRNRRELRNLLFHQAVAVYTSSKLKPEQVEDLSQKISDLYYDIRETYYPEAKDQRIQHEKQLVRQDIKNWEARYGDTSSEDTQKKLKEFAAAMEKLRQDTAAEMRKSAASQLGYMGRELGIDPEARRKKPRKGK